MQKEIKMALKLLFLPQNRKNYPAAGALPPGPLCDTRLVASVCSARDLKKTIFVQKHLRLVQAPALLGKPWLRFWSESLLQADFPAILRAAYETS